MDKFLSLKKSLKLPKLSTKKEKLSLALEIILLVFLLYPVFEPSKAGASVTESFVRFDRHSTGAAISGTACLKTSTSGTESAVNIVFPVTWTVSSTPGNWTVSTSNLPVDPSDNVTTATAWPGINTATAVTATSVTFPSTDLSTGTLYCFNFAGASSTIGGAGNDQTGMIQTQGGSPFVDSVSWATSVVTSNADQITVSASVSATMTFSLSGNSVSLGTLSSSSTTAGSAITEHVSTNARNGWVSWIKSGTDGGSTNAALHSTLANANIVSPGTFDGTPETLSSTGGYVLDVNTGSGSPTVNAEYDGSGADDGGHLSYNLFRQTAYATAPANDNTVSLVVKARSAVTTPAAADYTDTLTVVAAGSF